uniref:Uncharacterized protein n=1 Tax=Populus trichocarpa TaxID=3694 RepID=A0A2K1YV39_POPTR
MQENNFLFYRLFLLLFMLLILSTAVAVNVPCSCSSRAELKVCFRRQKESIHGHFRYIKDIYALLFFSFLFLCCVATHVCGYMTFFIFFSRSYIYNVGSLSTFIEPTFR